MPAQNGKTPMRSIRAGYVWISDEQQQYRIANQQMRLGNTLWEPGAIVGIYPDPGQSGVAATDRTALQERLKDVIRARI